METYHHDPSRLVQIQRLIVATQELRQLVIKDFYNLLPWRNRTQDLLTERLAFYSADEIFRDLKMDVGFQQGQANLSQSVVNVCLRNGPMTPEVFEYVLEFVGKL